jgi:hypothetical protein
MVLGLEQPLPVMESDDEVLSMRFFCGLIVGCMSQQSGSQDKNIGKSGIAIDDLYKKAEETIKEEKSKKPFDMGEFVKMLEELANWSLGEEEKTFAKFQQIVVSEFLSNKKLCLA